MPCSLEKEKVWSTLRHHLCFSSGYRPKMPCSFSVLPRITNCLRYLPREWQLPWKGRNRSGGTRVYLDNIYVILLIHDKLDIEQTDDANAKTQLFGVFQNFCLQPCWIRKGGVYGDGSRSEHGTLYMLHDAGYRIHQPSETTSTSIPC